MILIKFKDKICRYPKEESLKKIINDSLQKDTVIIASQELLTSEEINRIPNFKLTEKGISLIKRRMADEDYKRIYDPKTSLISIDLEGQFPSSIDEILEGQVTNYKIINPSLNKDTDSFKDLPERIKENLIYFNFFSVGRVNGPSDQVVRDEIYEGLRIKYDVNSRIELSSGDYKLQFTFKPEKLRNIGKLTLPNNQIRVILQKDFNLWLLGLQVLMNDVKDSYIIFNNLIKQYEQAN